ncbi:ABC transporter permease [Desemzia sp. FAM 23991]|uniref:ABC transporter permease n=1 Tax=unclassified Desemzia TaxID=2685243 RepID=UPI00388850DB
MSVVDIWKRRLADHQKTMMKYLKYVLNDHFVIVCLFLLGALGYGYSETLKTVSTNFIYGRMIAVIVFSSILFIGKLATLTQSADIVFLLQKEKGMDAYFKKAKGYSMILPLAVIAFISAAVMPLLVATSSFMFTDWIFFFAYLAVLKEVELDAQWLKIKQPIEKERSKLTILVILLVVVSSMFALYLHPLAGLVSAVAGSVFWHFQIGKARQIFRYQWEYLVQKETARLKLIYQFINLFTDIPALKGTIKRRAYFDNLLKRIPLKHQNTYLYLFSKAIVRGTEYSGLVFRLSLIGVVVIALLANPLLNGMMSVLFLYLTGFQLIPLYYHYDNHLLSVLYPVDKNQKLSAMQTILLFLLVIQSSLFLVANLLTMPIVVSIGLFILNVLFSWLFSRFYLASRIKKLNKG